MRECHLDDGPSALAGMAQQLAGSAPAPAASAAAAPRSLIQRIRDAMEATGPMDAGQIAAVVRTDRAMVWPLIKGDLASGRMRRIAGSKPVLVELGTHFGSREVISWVRVAPGTMPDSELTLLLCDVGSDDRERQRQQAGPGQMQLHGPVKALRVDHMHQHHADGQPEQQAGDRAEQGPERALGRDQRQQLAP